MTLSAAEIVKHNASMLTGKLSLMAHTLANESDYQDGRNRNVQRGLRLASRICGMLLLMNESQIPESEVTDLLDQLETLYDSKRNRVKTDEEIDESGHSFYVSPRV